MCIFQHHGGSHLGQLIGLCFFQSWVLWIDTSSYPLVNVYMANWKKSPCLNLFNERKWTISMVIFNSELLVITRPGIWFGPTFLLPTWADHRHFLDSLSRKNSASMRRKCDDKKKCIDSMMTIRHETNWNKQENWSNPTEYSWVWARNTLCQTCYLQAWGENCKFCTHWWCL